jgi:predicted Zn-dependent peptidase
VREKHGLVYSIASFSSNLHDSGMFGFYASTSLESHEQVLEISLLELYKLSHSVTDAETHRAKAQLRAALIMGLENPSGRVESAVKQQFLFNKFFTPEELIAKVDAVTKQDIIDYANLLLQSKNPAFCALGNISDLSKSESIIKKFFQN